MPRARDPRGSHEMFCLSGNVLAEVLPKTFQAKGKGKKKTKGQLPFNNIAQFLQVPTYTLWMSFVELATQRKISG